MTIIYKKQPPWAPILLQPPAFGGWSESSKAMYEIGGRGAKPHKIRTEGRGGKGPGNKEDDYCFNFHPVSPKTNVSI